MSMFCYQCQETAKNTGCEKVGVCGKNDEVANLQDALMYALRGLAYWTVKAEAAGVDTTTAGRVITEGLFTTVTNVNFDPARFDVYLSDIFKTRDAVRAAYEKAKPGDNAHHPDAATWTAKDRADALLKAAAVGVFAEPNEDLRSLRELLAYGLKGVAAYAHHAYVLNYEKQEIYAYFAKALAALARTDIGADELFGLVIECGNVAVTTMALLDEANTTTYGKQEITHVSTATEAAPAILISGHDLRDLAELLEQTEGKGINIYTHGEMLPANAYPELKKHKHLKGNYGTAWWAQQEEFSKFGGAILFTTNCIQKPLASYEKNVYTTGTVGWPGLEHIADREGQKQKDFSPVINRALELGPIEARPGKTITIGFAKDQVLALAEPVVNAVKSGAIKRFVVMGGCDGRHKSREYFTEVAKALPQDAVILTAGCAKFRYNMLDLGDIGGIPRVLDAGQCNDSYSLAYIALKLKEVFGMESVNDLPLSFDIGWYEQKAVAVLLALLALGFKNVRLGPTLPAFLSPNIVNALVTQFNVMPTTTVEKDVEMIMTSH